MTIGRVAVLGGGAVGGVVAAHLAAVGCVVDLYDEWPDHVAAIRRDGLSIVGPTGERRYPVRAHLLEEATRAEDSYDVVLVSVKAYDTERVLRKFERCVAPQALVVSLQNGFLEDKIAQLVGPDRTAGIVVRAPAVLEGPGRIVQTVVPLGYTVGSLTGAAMPIIETLAQLLSVIAPTTIADNLAQVRWSKLLVNCQVNALCGITGWDTRSLLQDARGRRLCFRVGHEVAVVAESLGLTLSPYLGLGHRDYLEHPVLPLELEERMVAASAAEPAVRPSLLQDLERGRPTEILFLNGYVEQVGRRFGLETPMNSWVTRTVLAIESRREAMGPHHLLLAPHVGG